MTARRHPKTVEGRRLFFRTSSPLPTEASHCFSENLRASNSLSRPATTSEGAGGYPHFPSSEGHTIHTIPRPHVTCAPRQFLVRSGESVWKSVWHDICVPGAQLARCVYNRISNRGHHQSLVDRPLHLIQRRARVR